MPEPQRDLMRVIFAVLFVGALIGMSGYGSMFVGFLWGAFTAEAVRRASGGHRTASMAAVTIAGIVGGWFVAGFTGGMTYFTLLIAVIAALAQFAFLGGR